MRSAAGLRIRVSGIAAVKDGLAAVAAAYVVFATSTRVIVRCPRLILEASVAGLREFRRRQSDVKP